MNLRKCFSIRGVLGAALVVASLVSIQTAAQAQTLTGFANPPTGLAGSTNSYVTGSGFPAGAITGAMVHFGTSCSAPAAASGPVTGVTTIANVRRFQFLVPASLTSGTYSVWVSGSTPSAFNTLNTPSCASISVTATTTTLAACVPTSSLAVVAGANVTAYVPFGYWEGGSTGIEQVPLEGTGTAANFPTATEVNSCAANSVTGEVVCTENNTTVDLINGTKLTTLSSGANSLASFTGGSCENCGVGINAANNTAVIAMGIAGNSGEGVQVLNLSNNTFNAPFPMTFDVSEDISIDSGRNLILSPGEDSTYDLLKIGANNSLTEFSNAIGGNDLDSAAEDCTTGIALSSDEFSDDIYITDLTQATFTPGTPGTWSAPGQFLSLNDGGYAAGTSGISSAPGSNHLGVVTGEFGGSSFSALVLPSTSGTGTPTLADYAYVAAMPNTPDGEGFQAGFDPHTVTAYTSPNNNKSYAVFVDYATGTPNWLGVVDLACVVALPRTAGTHNVSGSTSSCTRYVAIP